MFDNNNCEYYVVDNQGQACKQRFPSPKKTYSNSICKRLGVDPIPEYF